MTPEEKRAKHTAYMREWSKLNPLTDDQRARKREMDRNRPRDRYARYATLANRRAVRLGADGVLTKDDVQAVLGNDPHCIYCVSTTRVGLDHIIPLARGGQNARENLQPCCTPCNVAKGLATRPGRWSRESDECTKCGRADRKHCSHGLCSSCYQRQWRTERTTA